MNPAAGVAILVGLALTALFLSRPAKAATTSYDYLLPKRDTEMMKTAAYHQISPQGIAMIKQHEGLHKIEGDGRVYPYLDPVGIPTIGWGHVILPGENFDSGITINQAEDLLRDDIAKAHASLIRQLPTTPITQGQYDALISFIFNLGESNFRDSTLRRKLMQGDYAGAASEFGRWVNAGGKQLPGLVARRRDEARVFMA